jgi:hypothetical protein
VVGGAHSIKTLNNWLLQNWVCQRLLHKAKTLGTIFFIQFVKLQNADHRIKVLLYRAYSQEYGLNERVARRKFQNHGTVIN